MVIQLIRSQMKCQIKRIDEDSEKITTQTFQTSDEAYYVLAIIHENFCCSDAA